MAKLKFVVSSVGGNRYLTLNSLLRFQKSSYRRKRSKIFLPTSAFSQCFFFHTETAENDKTRGTWNFATVRAITSVNFFVTVFKSLRFHLSTPKRCVFQKNPLLKPFPKVSVFINVFWRLESGCPAKTHQKACIFKQKCSSVVWA